MTYELVDPKSFKRIYFSLSELYNIYDNCFSDYESFVNHVKECSENIEFSNIFKKYIVKKSIRGNKYNLLMKKIKPEKEVWKTIEVNGIIFKDYQVSTYGRIYNKITDNYIKPILYSSRLYVKLMRDSKQERYAVPRIVAETFLVGKEKNDVVLSKNFDPYDTHVSNLKWCTWKEFRRYEIASRKTITKVYKLDRETGLVLDTYYSVKDAARENFVSVDTIYKNSKTNEGGCGYMWRIKRV